MDNGTNKNNSSHYKEQYKESNIYNKNQNIIIKDNILLLDNIKELI